MENVENMNRAESSPVQKARKVGSLPFTIVITVLISVFATLMVIYFANDGILFIKHSIYGDLTEVLPISEVLDNIEEEFYAGEGVRPDTDKLVLVAIRAMIDELNDPYAYYFTGEEYEQYLHSVNNSYTGLGISVAMTSANQPQIQEVFEKSPAHEAGLLTGDIILEVNGSSTEGLSLDEVSALLRGDSSSQSVTVKIQRDSQVEEITVKYGEVIRETVKTKELENDIGYIRIGSFTNTAAEEFQTAIDSFKNKKSLIIDLRNNPGGYLSSVVAIADMILDEGTIVSVGNTLSDPDLEVFTAQKGRIDKSIVVLVNENSASASEILAAALKDNNAATIVGVTTYGKGIVQTTGKLYSIDSYLKLTTAAYYTPNGENIHGKGVCADVTSVLADDLKQFDVTTLPLEKDTQLQAAIDQLLNK